MTDHQTEERPPSNLAGIAFLATVGLVLWRGVPPVWHWYLLQVWLNPPITHLQPGLWVLTAVLAVGLLTVVLGAAMLVSVAVDRLVRRSR
jgi:ABC-type thiamin/hydroxymethylpyrimidine transport system permease subunit